jgi:hypothetical protein
VSKLNGCYNFTVPCYKILRKSDGKFSNGGSCPEFTDRGKTWWTKGALTNHLIQSGMLRGQKPEHYENCEVVEYEVLNRATGIQTVDEYILERKKARENREAEKQERIGEIEKEERRQKFFELAEEFGNEL